MRSYNNEQSFELKQKIFQKEAWIRSHQIKKRMQIIILEESLNNMIMSYIFYNLIHFRGQGQKQGEIRTKIGSSQFLNGTWTQTKSANSRHQSFLKLLSLLQCPEKLQLCHLDVGAVQKMLPKSEKTKQKHKLICRRNNCIHQCFIFNL